MNNILQILFLIGVFVTFHFSSLARVNAHTHTFTHRNPVEGGHTHSPTLVLDQSQFADSLPNGYSLTIYSDKDTTFLRKQFEYQRNFLDSFSIHRELNRLLLELYDYGYLSARYDSVETDSNEFTAYLTIGDVFKWITLKNVNLDAGMLSHVGYREKLYSDKPFGYKQLRLMFEEILKYAEDNGYPFASIKMDSIVISGNSISARLYIKKNQLIIIDSIHVVGDVNIQQSYLYNYLGIKPGSLYNESVISKVSVRIKELPFATEEKPFNILFHEDRATLNLFLKAKKISQLYGLVGVLPNNESTGKLLVTGEARIKLQNPFGTGKVMNLHWRKLQPETQDLKINLVYPYILSFPLGADGSFDLYKKDSAYLDVIQRIGIQYMLTAGDYFEVFAKNKQTNLLDIDTASIRSTGKLPLNLDINVTTYGLGYKFERLDYRLNPRSGFTFSAQAGAGLKKIKENKTITDVNDALYDALDLKSTQYQVDYKLDVFIPIKNRSTIMLGSVGGGLWTQDIVKNELYRLGGLHMLRGFDEESIYASLFNVFTAEYRFLLDLNSYFYLFTDYAYYENEVNRNNGKPWIDRPFGFGTGISFETKAGIFSLSYALGIQMGNSLDVTSGKIHFGYLNYF
ncbi:MAG: hypothetical protein IIA45_08050 [Bacteroidetes bacterium]|nr:hypothetical protein [Bacteroidota bacterium]